MTRDQLAQAIHRTQVQLACLRDQAEQIAEHLAGLRAQLAALDAHGQDDPGPDVAQPMTIQGNGPTSDVPQVVTGDRASSVK
jgi:hypothetical protein